MGGGGGGGAGGRSQGEDERVRINTYHHLGNKPTRRLINKLAKKIEHKNSIIWETWSQRKDKRVSINISQGRMLQQTKPRPWGRRQLSHGQQRQRASATERRRTVKRGFDATCCGRVKEGPGAGARGCGGGRSSHMGSKGRGVDVEVEQRG